MKKTLITCGEAGDPSGAVAAQQKLHAADPLNNGTDGHFAPFSALQPLCIGMMRGRGLLTSRNVTGGHRLYQRRSEDSRVSLADPTMGR